MVKLAVNVDHVATLRQARMTDFPDPVQAARMALEEGVSGITVHLREDRRHIQEDDVRRIRTLNDCKLNLEMAAEEEIIKIALDIVPDQVTLVPEKREELTTEGGLDVVSRQDFYGKLTQRFNEKGITVSFFIDPDPLQIQASSETLGLAIELNTAAYTEAKTEKDTVRCLRKIRDGVEMGKALGLIVHAGHGLNYENVRRLSEIEGIEELNIGHSIVAQSIFVGFSNAVSTMQDIMQQTTKRMYY